MLKVIQSCVLVFCAAGLASAQSALSSTTPPPVKMGLWETSVTSQITGLQLPPQVIEKLKQMGRPIPGSAPHTTVTQSCLTPAEWQKDMENMNKPKSSDCDAQKREDSPTKYTFDMSCKTERGMTMQGHWEMDVLDSEHAHGSGHMASDQPGPNGQTFSVTMTLDSKYLDSDCGDVKPGEPKVMQE